MSNYRMKRGDVKTEGLTVVVDGKEYPVTKIDVYVHEEKSFARLMLRTSVIEQGEDRVKRKITFDLYVELHSRG